MRTDVGFLEHSSDHILHAVAVPLFSCSPEAVPDLPVISQNGDGFI